MRLETMMGQRRSLPLLRMRLRALTTHAWLDSLAVIWRQALLPYLGTRLIVFLVSLLADFTILATEKAHAGKPKLADATQFPQLLWTNWAHFDSGFYLGLAISGYPHARPTHPYSTWEFYPLFPALIHPLGRLLRMPGVMKTWTSFTAAGLIVANVAALIAIGYLFVLVRREFDERVATRTVLLLSLFASSFFLSAVYSESVFLAPAVACLYYTRGHRWLGAGICGALATLARGPGILLLLPVAWELWQALADRYAPLPDPPADSRRERIGQWMASRIDGLGAAIREWRAWGALLAILLIPLAQVGFMIYARIETGHFGANLEAIRLWQHRFTWPWQSVYHDLVLHPPAASDAWTYDPLFQSIVLLILFFILTIAIWYTLPTTFALYATCMYLVPLCTGYVTSLARYYLVIFPAFIVLARWCDPERHLQRYTLVVAASTAWLAMLTAFFVLGFPASGA